MAQQWGALENAVGLTYSNQQTNGGAIAKW